MKEILYIHGYNSSGSTGRALENLLKDFTKVHHFQIPQKPVEALSVINTYLNMHPLIGLIVGSSLGGFITSRISGYMKLLINPCMLPSVELPKLGCDTAISDLYQELENEFAPDYEERACTFLMFGTNDELFSYKEYCHTKYVTENMSVMVDVKHHLNETDLETFIVPKVKELLTVDSKELFEHFDMI